MEGKISERDKEQDREWEEKKKRVRQREWA